MPPENKAKNISGICCATVDKPGEVGSYYGIRLQYNTAGSYRKTLCYYSNSIMHNAPFLRGRIFAGKFYCGHEMRLPEIDLATSTGLPGCIVRHTEPC